MTPHILFLSLFLPLSILSSLQPLFSITQATQTHTLSPSLPLSLHSPNLNQKSSPPTSYLLPPSLPAPSLGPLRPACPALKFEL
ncbi:hypothetical protein HDK64DRAFT_47818 [Phyllosticta capitalensis]